MLENVLHQDNTSTILLEKNRRKSTRKQTRHLNIRLFYVTDQYKRGNIKIKYCPTEDMTANYMSKPVMGQKFKKFRKEIMNLPVPVTSQLVMWCFLTKKHKESM